MQTIEVDELAARLQSFESSEILVTDTQRQADRWLLSSNLQKAIRRGLTETALQSAQRLAYLNEAYLWRRLVVIGFEDMGLAEPTLCADLLKIFRRVALRRHLGELLVLQYFVSRMCEAKKNRSLCDAIAALDFGAKIDLRGYGPQQLVDLAVSDEEEFALRVAACREICGWTEFVNGTYRQRAAVNRNAMEVIADRMRLSQRERFLFLSGNNNSELMNVPMPVMAQLFRLSELKQTPTKRFEFEGYDGILFSALDRHTRVGKQAMRIIVSRHGAAFATFRRPVEALGVALFIAEGALSNRPVSARQLTPIRHAFETTFFAHHGIERDEVELISQICVTVRSELDALRLKALA